MTEFEKTLRLYLLESSVRSSSSEVTGKLFKFISEAPYERLLHATFNPKKINVSTPVLEFAVKKIIRQKRNLIGYNLRREHNGINNSKRDTD